MLESILKKYVFCEILEPETLKNNAKIGKCHSSLLKLKMIFSKTSCPSVSFYLSTLVSSPCSSRGMCSSGTLAPALLLALPISLLWVFLQLLSSPH